MSIPAATGAVSRRSVTAAGLQAWLVAALFQQSVRAQALDGTLRWSVRPWLQQLDEATAALSGGGITPRAWQEAVEALLGKIELGDFLRALDFDRLAAAARFPATGEGMDRLYFPDPSGRLQPLAFRPYLFTLKKGTAVVPHGHHNMATMHMVLEGRARVRHFDRVATTSTHLVIRPAADVVGGPGAVTSISDEHQNIHWIEPLTDRVFMFNIGVYQVRPGPFGERDYVDPLGGADLGGGLVRAARLDRAAAYAKYG